MLRPSASAHEVSVTVKIRFRIPDHDEKTHIDALPEAQTGRFSRETVIRIYFEHPSQYLDLLGVFLAQLPLSLSDGQDKVSNTKP